jgi:hypothetical protein
MALAVDWSEASVSPSGADLQVGVTFGPVPKDAEYMLLSQTLGQLPSRSGPIKKVELSGNAIRLQITTDADVRMVQRSVAAKLEEFTAHSERRREDAERKSAKEQVEREQAEATALEVQSRFRQLD